MSSKVVKKKDFEKRKGLEKNLHQDKKHTSVDISIDTSRVLHKSTLEAKDKAEKIIESAETEANEIKEKAQKILAEVEAVREKARSDGYAKGETEGFSQVTEKIVLLETLKEKFYKEAEPEIIKLVIAIAEKVIGNIVEEKPEAIQDVVRQALERSLGDRITVRLNPQDYKTIIENQFEFKDVLDRTKRLHFKEDDTIAQGGCIVETEVGTIDAQIQTQMEAIRKALEL